jgi:hypothetical protein
MRYSQQGRDRLYAQLFIAVPVVGLLALIRYLQTASSNAGAAKVDGGHPALPL